MARMIVAEGDHLVQGEGQAPGKEQAGHDGKLNFVEYVSVVGGAYMAGGGFKIVGAHTDSPVLKVKPVSKTTHKASGCLQLGVECYGGGLWHTWFDRDLSVAGSAIVKTAEGGFERRLMHCKRPFMRVPNLAIHLQSPAERASFTINKETHLMPVLGIDMAILAEDEPRGGP